MPRLIVAALLLLALCSAASAQTVSAIIPLTQGQTSAGGFRDIPPGPATFQLTLQSNSGGFDSTYVMSSNANVTWVPQSNAQGATVHVWVTSAACLESGSAMGEIAGIGTASGYGYYPGMMMDPNILPANFYTTNAYWTDVYDSSGQYAGGPYYDAGTRMASTDTSLPSSLPGDGTGGATLPSLSLQGSGSGTLWFTSDSASVAVYRLDASSNTWVPADQAFPVTLPSGPGQLALRATADFAGASPAQVTIHYLSNDSVNPTADGDTLDILYVCGDYVSNLGG